MRAAEEARRTEDSWAHRLCDGVGFFLRFLREPRRLGVPFPHNGRIAAAVAAELRKHSARRVVELGGGTGSLTRGILEVLDPAERLLCIERDGGFCRRLATLFSERVEVVQGDALDVLRLIKGTVWERPDAVVCSVPLLGGVGPDLCGAIASVLPREGVYLQVTNVRKPIEEFFEIRRSRLFLSNIPPEHLYCAFPKQRW